MPTESQLSRCPDWTDKHWVIVYELELAALEESSLEKCIQIESKLNPNWTDEDSKALVERRARVLEECRKNLEEARARASQS